MRIHLTANLPVSTIPWYIFKILEDGNSNFQQYNGSHSYIYLPRARAAIGFKPDKSVVLLTAGLGSITGSNQAGPSLFELAELLKLEGCTEGFNLDGGGSASIVARTETGGLEMLNTHPTALQEQSATEFYS